MIAKAGWKLTSTKTEDISEARGGGIKRRSHEILKEGVILRTQTLPEKNYNLLTIGRNIFTPTLL